MPSSLQKNDNRSAQRFPVTVPVRMRLFGDDSEAVYWTRNVSCRGVFVLTDEPLPENSSIQFTMNLRSPHAPEEGVQVLCQGTVVRVETLPEGSSGMAATIDSYRFLHAHRASA